MKVADYIFLSYTVLVFIFGFVFGLYDAHQGGNLIPTIIVAMPIMIMIGWFAYNAQDKSLGGDNY